MCWNVSRDFGNKVRFVRFCMKLCVKMMMPIQLFPVSCIFCLISTSILMVKVKGVVSMKALSLYVHILCFIEFKENFN